jgi:hypothetical protein
LFRPAHLECGELERLLRKSTAGTWLPLSSYQNRSWVSTIPAQSSYRPSQHCGFCVRVLHIGCTVSALFPLSLPAAVPEPNFVSSLAGLHALLTGFQTKGNSIRHDSSRFMISDKGPCGVLGCCQSNPHVNPLARSSTRAPASIFQQVHDVTEDEKAHLALAEIPQVCDIGICPQIGRPFPPTPANYSGWTAFSASRIMRAMSISLRLSSLASFCSRRKASSSYRSARFMRMPLARSITLRSSSA